MPIVEYLSWQEFYAIEPWGLATHDAMQAHLASILANVNRDTKRRPQPYEFRDFLLYRPRSQAVEENTGDEVRINGLTAHQHQLLLGFEALQRQLDAKE